MVCELNQFTDDRIEYGNSAWGIPMAHGAFILFALLIATAGYASETQKALVLPPGISAPALRAKVLDGDSVPEWKTLKGKVVVVDFWATWCTPCVAAFPKFNALVDRYAPQKVQFFSITYEPVKAVNAF